MPASLLAATHLSDTTLPAAAATSGGAGAALASVRDAGRYERGREIARGGMGRIVAVRDRELGRTMAVKELLHATPELEQRFAREVELTSRLQHPSIIALYEAGRWPSGELFYAMKHVDGRPLDSLISAQASLSDRLALLPRVIAVADALAYAHGAGVIHRDLKPGNVLVGAHGETVVIDWGLAKVLEPHASDDPRTAGAAPCRSEPTLTQEGETVGTPAYMPPEQARGENVDARADVYALGAMLYHLLAGQYPYADLRPRTAAELVHTVATAAPTPIARIAPDAPADLIAIVETAMARDARARYPTARELAIDLRRFEAGQLVGAHRYSVGQLARRWLRRHRTAVAVGAAAVIVLAVVGVVGLRRILREERLAATERAVAVEHRRAAEELLGFMLFDLRDRLKAIGRVDLLRVVAARAGAYYDARPAADDLVEQRKRAVAVSNLADVMLAEGDPSSALAQFRAALVIGQRLRGRDPADLDVLHDVAVVHSRIGDALRTRGDLDEAASEYRVAAALSAELAAHDPSNPDAQRDVAMSQERYGNLLLRMGRAAEGTTALDLALAIRERTAAAAPDRADDQRDLALSRMALADRRAGADDLAGALAGYRGALALIDGLVRRDPTNVIWQRDLEVVHVKLGTAQLAHGAASAALAEYRLARAIAERVATADPDNARARRDLAVGNVYVGDARWELQDLAGAVEAYAAGVAIAEQLAAGEPSNVEWQQDVLDFEEKLGGARLERGEARRAREDFARAVVVAAGLVVRHPTNPGSRRDLAAMVEAVGDASDGAGDAAAAVAAYRAALAIIDERRAAGDPDRRWAEDAVRVTRAIDARAR